jgi:hypothetical protein
VQQERLFATLDLTLTGNGFTPVPGAIQLRAARRYRRRIEHWQANSDGAEADLLC